MGQKKTIGRLNGRPIVTGDKNLVTKNEYHVENLSGGSGTNNFGNYIWLDYNKLISASDNNILDFAEFIMVECSTAMTVVYIPDFALQDMFFVMPVSAEGSGTIPRGFETYIGIPQYVTNIDSTSIVDIFSLPNINKEMMKEYIVPASKAVRGTAVGIVMS